MTEQVVLIGDEYLAPWPPVTDCICQELNSVLDPDAFNYERSNGVVIYNNSGHMVSTCKYGHRAHVFSLYLCSPDYEPLKDMINNNRITVKRRYDTLGHPASD